MTTPAWCRRVEGATILDVWAVPNGRRSEVVGEREGALRIRLAAPAREGRANAELVRFLAATLGVPRSSVTVVRGGSARRKQVAISVEGLEVGALVAGFT